MGLAMRLFLGKCGPKNISHRMKAPIFAAALLSSLSVTALVHQSLAQAPDDILAKDAKFSPTINFSDTYREKVVTIKSERIPGEPAEPATHEVVVKPQKISAKVVANIEGFDLSEIDDSMEVGIEIGAFSFSSPLSESAEALKAGGFPVEKKKATFPAIIETEKVDRNGDPVLDRDGNPVLLRKKLGRIVFAWAKKRLTVTVSISDVVLAEMNEIGASEFLGLYMDESENGNKPSGSAKFSDAPIEVSVTFGSAQGTHTALAKGTSTTSHKKYGRDEEGFPLEELDVNSVKLTGKADPNASADK